MGGYIFMGGYNGKDPNINAEVGVDLIEDELFVLKILHVLKCRKSAVPEVKMPEVAT